MGKLTSRKRQGDPYLRPGANPRTHGPCQSNSSPVILLGGVPGVGKTTLGNALLGELGLTHHISTGFLRAAIDGFLPEAQARLLRRHAFDSYEELGDPQAAGGDRILQGCIAQAELLKPIFRACINRARQEGIGLVLEGSHFIPGVIDPREYGANLLCILDVPNREELKARALSPNHIRRRLSEWDLERLVLLQDQLLTRARRHNRPMVVNIDLGQAVREVKWLVGGVE